MAPADAFEAILVRLNDDEWSQARLSMLTTASGPVLTGDPVIDALERDLWNEQVMQKAMKGLKEGVQ